MRASFAGLLTSNMSSTTTYAMQFDGTKNHQVNCGYKFDPSATYYSCLYEAWVCMVGTSGGYLVVDGYGPYHAILFGVQGNEATGYNIVGNFATGTDGNSYGSFDKIYVNEWHHVAVSLSIPDMAIVVFIDGIPSGIQTFVGDRSVAGIPGGGNGGFMIGGTGHSSFNGYCKTVRGYEMADALAQPLPYIGGVTPSNNKAYVPEKAFRGKNLLNYGASPTIVADTLYDFTVPTRGTIPDLMGHNHGKRSCNQSDLTEDNAIWGQIDPLNMTEANYSEANYPQFRPVNFALTATYNGPAPMSIPTGAIVFDDFRVIDISPSWYNPSLGITAARTGQVPTGSHSTDWGIRDGKAFCRYPAINFLIWESATADHDVTMTRPAPASYSQAGQSIGLMARYIDANNWVWLTFSGTGYSVLKNVATVQTTIASGTHGIAGWTTARMVCNGNVAQVYVDGVQQGGDLDISGTSGTGAGLLSWGDPLVRYESILVKAS